MPGFIREKKESNGFYVDIHAGAADEAHLDALGEHLGQITWKQTPQK